MQRWANLALEEFELIAEGCGLGGDPGETGEQSDEGPLEEDRPQTGSSQTGSAQTGSSKSQSVKSLMAGSHRGGIP
jgi:hypothetical protein